MNRAEQVIKNLSVGECVYIKRPENVFYFSSFKGEGALIISQTKKILITDFRYVFDAKNSSEGYDIVTSTENLFDDFNTVYVEDDFLTLKEFNSLCERYKSIKFLNRDFSSKLRVIKDDDEIKKIKKASRIAEEAFEKLLGMVDENVTEKELACEFEYLVKKAGAEKTSFDTIAASGVNSSKPHAVAENKKICPGDFITFDFGCVYDGYCSDMTRTVAYKSATEKMKNVYEIVLEAQKVGVKNAVCGVRCSDVDKMSRNIIEKNGYGKNFGHSLGHGVGLFIHENPTLSPRCDTVLEDNMVVTVEPGIYIENEFGVRIEDLLVISGKNPEVLTKFEKKLIII